MNIGIMCSIDFADDVIEISKQLIENGHTVSLPYTVEKIANGDMTLDDVLTMKQDGTFAAYAQEGDLIRWNWNRMQNDDAILVVNLEKNGVPNYIGGNTFLEMGFAHILDKNIYLWRDIPDVSYRDEIEVMNPVVLYEDIGKL